MMTMRGDEASKQELRDLIYSTGLKHIRMLEIGSYAGESTEVFASMPEVDHITSVDPYDKQDESGKYLGRFDVDLFRSDDISAWLSDMHAAESAFYKVLEKYSSKITKFKGVFDEYMQSYRDSSHIDLVYIDASHAYECVSADIDNAIKTGARFIAGHDLWCKPGVKKAVVERFGWCDAVFNNDSSWIVDVHRKMVPFSVADMMSHAIVLHTTPARYDAFMSRMKAAGFDYDILSCPGVVIDDSHRGASLGHLRMLSVAQTLKWPYVTLFEDDATPLKDCKAKLTDFLAGGIPSDATSLIWGTMVHLNKSGRHLRELKGSAGRWGFATHCEVWGAQAVTWFSNAYARAIDKITKGSVIDWFCETSYHPFWSTKSFFTQCKAPGVFEYTDFFDPSDIEANKSQYIGF